MSGWDDIVAGALNDINDASTAVDDGRRRQADRKLSSRQRKENARQRARVRVFYDVPDWLRDAIVEMAATEDVSISSLAAYLLAVGFRSVRTGKSRVNKVPSNSPRFSLLVETTERDAGL